MTGTVTATRDTNAVTLTLRVAHADFLDLLSGLAWVDILGGFGAWRVILPTEMTPPQLAGQFNLRRTYSDPSTDQWIDELSSRTHPATPETPLTRPTPAAAAGAREDPARVDVSGEQAGCRGCRDQRDEAEQLAREVATVTPAPDAVAGETGAAGVGRFDWLNYAKMRNNGYTGPPDSTASVEQCLCGHGADRHNQFGCTIALCDCLDGQIAERYEHDASRQRIREGLGKIRDMESGR